MSISVVREDGQPSRHPWYRIPATVEIDGWRYPIQEWSVEGFSVAGVDDPATPGDVFAAQLVFRFDGFSTLVDVDAEVIRHDPDDDGIVCHFPSLSRQKAAVLRAVIDSYLLGEFVSMDDIIHVVKRDLPEEPEAQGAAAPPRGRIEALRTLSRRWAGLALVSLLLVAVAVASAWAGFRRLYVAESVAALVTGPLVVIRAPQPSFFASAPPQQLETVDRQIPLAYVELIGGGSATIESPCNCLIVKQHVLDAQFVSTGEPLFTLMPRGGAVHVSAQVPVEQARNVAIGDHASITLPNRRTVAGRVREVLYGEPPERSLSAPLSRTRSNAISFYEVVVTPDEPLNVDLIGVAASVEISTYRGPGSSHRELEGARER
jgi:alginate biosynthesis protein Alg44